MARKIKITIGGQRARRGKRMRGGKGWRLAKGRKVFVGTLLGTTQSRRKEAYRHLQCAQKIQLDSLPALFKLRHDEEFRQLLARRSDFVHKR
jgi:hypothetical protein